MSVIKKNWLLPLLLLFALPAVAEDFSSVTGFWKTIDDETGEAKSIVKIYEEGGVVKGKIVKLLQNPDAVCSQCSGSQKDQPIQGMVIIWGVQELNEKSGYILNPKNGKVYKLQLFRQGADLMVRGYISLFYKTQRWLPASRP